MSSNSTNYGQLAVFGAQIAVGAIISVSNIIIVACVLSYRALRNQKEFVLLAALALADAVNQGNAIPAYIYRTWLLLTGRMGSPVSPISCLFKPHMFTWLFSNQMASAMLVTISVDRALLVSFPHTYLKLGARYAYSVVAVLYTSCICMAVVGVMFVATNEQEAIHSPLCMATPAILGAGAGAPVRSLYALYLAKSPIILAFGSVVLYACIYPINRMRKAKIAPMLADKSRELKRQRKLTKNLTLSCVCTFCLYCVPFQLAMFYKNRGELAMAGLFFLLCTLNAFSNLFIYQWKIPELRTALRSLGQRKHLPDNLRLWPKPGGTSGDQNNRART